jgi:hypothetical protein
MCGETSTTGKSIGGLLKEVATQFLREEVTDAGVNYARAADNQHYPQN